MTDQIIARPCPTGNSFDETRPADGEKIEAFFMNGKWYKVTYYEDGIDGILEDEDGMVTELEEYGKDMVWRPIV